MVRTPMRRVLPAAQRRTLAELTDDLDLMAGDRASKQSAFWTMLLLASLIASAGVLADSTATVIGAMIIAPLATPIMGVALGIAKGSRSTILSALAFVAGGALLVVVIGAVFSLVLPSDSALLSNGQITSRTSPGLLDLIAALATGLAGAVGLARRDVSSVLPGVAIAVSLVPPLAVLGICAGRGSFGLALGAGLLFASNFLALVLAGTLIFAAVGYTTEAALARGRPRRNAYVTLGVLLLFVGVPLVGNTVANYILSVLTERVHTAADVWIAEIPGAEVQDVELVGTEIVISVRTPGDLPPSEDLLDSLGGQFLSGLDVVVNTTSGDRVDLGSIG